MNERQKLAYEDPCSRAYHTTKPKFHRVLRARNWDREEIVSTILTVNK